MFQDTTLGRFFKRLRNSKTYTLFVVFVAVFVDSMLVTVLVPLIPYLLNTSTTSELTLTASSNSTSTSETSSLATGILFASKAGVQLLVNPIIGPLTTVIGFNIPMLTGFIIMFTSTMVFAFGETYWVLLGARAFQGLGSSCTTVAGLGYLATIHPDDQKRGKAMGTAMSGVALGLLLGPPFASIINEFCGPKLPFFILAAIALVDGVLQLIFFQPGTKYKVEEDTTSIMKLARDPYILTAAFSVFFAHLGLSVLEPTLPTRMTDTMDSPAWQLGVVFVPCNLAFLIGTRLFAPITYKLGRWLGALVGLVGCSAAVSTVPLGQNMYELLPSLFVLGFSIGLLLSSIMPHLGYLVDYRHSASYGSVYAVGDVALCLAFCLGPIVSGAVLPYLGFPYTMYIIGALTLCYAPLMFLLKNPPGKKVVSEIPSSSMSQKETVFVEAN